MSTPDKPSVILKKHEAHFEKEQKQKKYLLAGLIITIVLVVGLVGYGLLDQFVLQSYRPIATVGDTQISIGYFQRITWLQRYILYNNHRDLANLYLSSQENQYLSYIYGQQVQAYEQQLAASNTTQIGTNILNRMIEDTLIAKEAEKRGITVSDEEVNSYMQEKIFAFYPNGTPTAAPSPTPYSTSTLSPTQLALVPPTATMAPTQEVTEQATATATLDPNLTPSPTATEMAFPTPTPYTLDAYNQSLDKFISDGKVYNLSVDDVKAFLRGFILRDKLTEALSADLKPEQEEVWARHILVADEATAKQVTDRLNKGEDFTKIAAELSTDTGSKDSGGDLGWFPRGRMVSEFENAAFGLEIGQVSDPIQTQFGYHIIQVLGHEIRPITQSELDNLKSEKMQAWLDEAMTTNTVTKVDNFAQYIPTEPALKDDEIVFPN